MKARTGLLISAGSIIQQGSQFLFGIIVARALGPADYGWFSIGRNALIWAATLAPLGLDVAMIRYASQHGATAQFWSVLSRLRVIVALISVATMVAIVGFSGIALGSGAALVMAASLAALPFVADSALLGGYYRGMRRPALFSVIFDYGQSALRLMVGGGLVVFGATVVVFALANSAIAALGALAVAVVAFSVRPNAGQPGSSINARSILTVGPWLAISLVSYGLLRILDLMVLGAHVSSDELGRYAAIAAVSVFVQVYPMTLSQALGPEIAELSMRSDARSAGLAIREFVGRASVAGAFVYGGIAIFGTHLDLIFGDKFHFDSWTLLLMSTAWLLSGVLNPTGYALSMTGRHRSESMLLVGGAALFAFLLFALVPTLGARGAAGALLLAMLFIQGGRVVLVSRLIDSAVVRARDLLPPVLALGIAKSIDLVVEHYLGQSFATLVGECVTYTAAYGLSVLGFRYFRRRLQPDLAR